MLSRILLHFGGWVLVLAAYLLLWPVPIDPVAWSAPKNAGYAGPFSANYILDDIEHASLDGF
jgi:hypothetical protein